MIDRGVGAVVVAIGAFLLLLTLRLPDSMLGDSSGHRFMPFALALTLIGLGLALAAKGGGGRPAGGRVWGGGWRLAAVVALTFGYAAVLTPLGYLVATAVVMVALLALYNPGCWLTNAAVGVAFSLSSYYVFHVLLGVYVPAGLLR